MAEAAEVAAAVSEAANSRTRMAYPDFTTSHAPDFVSNILKIPGMYNEMGNANARTAIAQQQAATQRWMAEIEAKKKEQEMANDPAIQDRAERLAQSEINLRTQQSETNKAMLAGNLTAQSFENMEKAARGKQAQDMMEDRELQIKFNSDILHRPDGPMAPDVFATDGGQKLLSDYSTKFHNPNGAFYAYGEFAKSNPEYGAAIERKDHFTEDALTAYKDAVDVQKMEPPQAMAYARDVNNRVIEQRKADAAAMIEREKARGKAEGENSVGPDTLTTAEDQQLKSYLGREPKNSKVTPAQRSRAAAALTNEIVASRSRGGVIDEAKIPEIWNRALKGDSYKASDLDPLFNLKK